MIQRRQHLRFALEARQSLRICRERLGQDLDRDVASSFVSRARDRPRPSRPRRASRRFRTRRDEHPGRSTYATKSADYEPRRSRRSRSTRPLCHLFLRDLRDRRGLRGCFLLSFQLQQRRWAAVPETRHCDRESEPACTLCLSILLRLCFHSTPERFACWSHRPRPSAWRTHAEALAGVTPGDPVVIVGASRGAADDLARDIARSRPATFGVQRFSLMQLAARTALTALASAGTTPSTWLGSEAIAARAAFDATRESTLEYFAPVAATPGFPRALARTLQELRLANVDGRTLSPFAPAGPDLAWLLERFEAGFARAASVDKSRLFQLAARRLRQAESRTSLAVLVDVPIEDAAARELVEAVTQRASSTIATVPHGDHDTLEHFRAMGAVVEERSTDGTTDLAFLRRFLFDTTSAPSPRVLDGSLEFFSAPGEGRECVEIARRILDHAKRGRSLRRDGDSRPHRRRTISACSSTRSGARACRRGSIAAPGDRIPPAARFSHCSRARPSSCRRRGLPSISRWARCRMWVAGPRRMMKAGPPRMTTRLGGTRPTRNPPG